MNNVNEQINKLKLTAACVMSTRVYVGIIILVTEKHKKYLVDFLVSFKSL